MSDSNTKVLVKNTATHPAMRIPPGRTGLVDEAVLKHARYLVRVKPAADVPAGDGQPERKPRGGKGKPDEQPAADVPAGDGQPERS